MARLTPPGQDDRPAEHAPVYKTAEFTELTAVLLAKEEKSLLARLWERVTSWLTRPPPKRRSRKPSVVRARYLPPPGVALEEDGQEITARTLAAVREALEQMDADTEPSAA